MVTNLETRQNDVVESSNNSGGGDLLREMYRDFKKLVKKGKETYKQNKNEKDQKRQREEQEKDQEKQRKNQEKQRKNQEKQDKKDQKRYGDTDSINSFSGWHDYNKERRNDFDDIDELIDELHRLGNYEIKTKKLPGSYPGGQKYTDKTIYGKNYELNIRDEGDYCRVKSIILKDPDNPNDQVKLTDPTIGDYRRVIDLIKADCANKKKETQDRNARAMKKAIAQNHEKYHQQEEQQADADLESQLSNLA